MSRKPDSDPPRDTVQWDAHLEVCGQSALPADYMAEAPSMSFGQSVPYGFQTLLALIKFLAQRLGVRRSLGFTDKIGRDRR